MKYILECLVSLSRLSFGIRLLEIGRGIGCDGSISSRMYGVCND